MKISGGEGGQLNTIVSYSPQVHSREIPAVHGPPLALLPTARTSSLCYYYFRCMPSLEPSSVVCHPITYHMYFNLISFTVRDESVINNKLDLLSTIFHPGIVQFLLQDAAILLSVL